MGLEAVLEEIREKGKKEADAIRAESTADSDRILAEANRKVGGIKTEAEEASAKQASRMIAQEISAANLLVKREILNTQKGLLDDVYEGTRKEIAKLPESFHREAIKKLLTEAKKEIPRGSIHCNARDVGAAKVVLAEKEFSGYTLGEPVDIDGGILIEGEGGELQIDYSYRTFMNKVWESGLKDASDLLFG
ncbi:MAG: V-type ATP synthase subunit E family protein [Methanoregula sp.]|uniref:V-type ATP synthase subunit E family protein n=1 Tax=Methanoregula sp. TaxID=2052170 RepID=UPI003BB1123A